MEFKNKKTKTKAKNLVKMWTWSRGRRRLQVAIWIEAFTVFWENFYRPIWKIKEKQKRFLVNRTVGSRIRKRKRKERERESEYLPWLWTQSKNYEFQRERLKKNAKIREREREIKEEREDLWECERERECVCVCVLYEFWEVKRNGGFRLNGSLNCEECEPSDWNLEMAVVSNGYIIYQFSFWSVACLFSIYIQVCIFWNFWVSGAAQWVNGYPIRSTT